MNKIFDKYNLIYLLFIVAIICLGFLIFKQKENSDRQKIIEENIILQKELSNNILRSLSIYSTKEDLEKIIKDNKVDLDVIKKDLDKLNGNITSLSKIEISSIGYNNSNINSSWTEPRIYSSNISSGTSAVNPISVENAELPNFLKNYLSNKQVLKIDERFETSGGQFLNVPLGEVGFEAWKDAPWSLKIGPRSYRVLTVLGETGEGKQVAYNKFLVGYDGKEYEIKINDAEIIQEIKKEEFRFNPLIFGSFSFGINATSKEFIISPGIMINFLNYGKSKKDIDLAFMNIGIGYDKNVNVQVSPISYNIKNKLTMFNNLYIAPTFSINSLGNFSIMGSIQTSF